jgi:hypothetical protein
MTEVKDAELQKYLGIYHAQYQLVKNVYYEKGAIKAELIPFIYPFTVDDADYVNATQLHLYLSQLAYILIAKAITDTEYTDLSKIIKFDLFMDKMIAGRLFFAKLEQTMKKVIYKKNLPISAEMKIKNVRMVKGTGFCEVEFNIGNSACSGNLLLSMQLTN